MARSLLICFVLVFVYCDNTVTAYPDFIYENGLDSNGSNVCSYPATNVTRVKVLRQHQYVEPYPATCYQGVWLGKYHTIQFGCIKTRIRRVNYHGFIDKTLHGYSLRCCHRWKRVNPDDKECLKPICIHECRHGKCVAGNTCACEQGWRGYTCSMDINECYSQNGGCQYDCFNTGGSHRCGCFKGYTTDHNDPTKCIDVDECNTPKPRCHCSAGSDPQCNATCTNTIGSYRCNCPTGYRLNGLFTCMDLDECLSSSTNTCPHNCANTAGSFKCSCFKGFQYVKKSNTCEDINECNRNNGGCAHQCLNMYSSYRCRCKLGYRMGPDRKSCIKRPPSFRTDPTY